MNDTNIELWALVGNSLYAISASRYSYEGYDSMSPSDELKTITVETATIYTLIENGFLPVKLGKTEFNTIAEGVAEFNRLSNGGELVSEEQADEITMTAPLAPLPPMPAGMVEGTHAHSAWMMFVTGVMDGDEADQWKDDMKDGLY